jgi:hypothetical protein
LLHRVGSLGHECDMPLVRRGANFASLRSKADGSRRFTFGKLSAVTIVSSDVRDALRQLIDVTGASKALAHAQFPLLEAHQRKGGVRQRGFYGDSGNRSAAPLATASIASLALARAT